jgi:hypothetical protein
VKKEQGQYDQAAIIDKYLKGKRSGENFTHEKKLFIATVQKYHDLL